VTKDEQAISEIVSQLEAAWNAGDRVKWASHFKNDASVLSQKFVEKFSSEGAT